MYIRRPSHHRSSHLPVGRWGTIPLRVLIQNSTTSGLPYLTEYIQITGILAVGSNITIEGGIYDFTDSFIKFPSGDGLTIQDGSTFVVVGGTYQMHFPQGSSRTTFIECLGPLTISTGSKLSIFDNTMMITDLSVTSISWRVYAYYVASPITLSTNSSFALSNNIIKASNLSVSGSWEMYTLYSATTNSPITVITNSTLSISNNLVDVANVTMGSVWLVSSISTNLYSPLVIDIGSSLLLANNILTASNMSVAGGWSLYTINAISSHIAVSTVPWPSPTTAWQR